jgi:hypothetical protein
VPAQNLARRRLLPAHLLQRLVVQPRDRLGARRVDLVAQRLQLALQRRLAACGGVGALAQLGGLLGAVPLLGRERRRRRVGFPHRCLRRARRLGRRRLERARARRRLRELLPQRLDRRLASRLGGELGGAAARRRVRCRLGLLQRDLQLARPRLRLGRARPQLLGARRGGRLRLGGARAHSLCLGAQLLGARLGARELLAQRGRGLRLGPQRCSLGLEPADAHPQLRGRRLSLVDAAAQHARLGLGGRRGVARLGGSGAVGRRGGRGVGQRRELRLQRLHLELGGLAAQGCDAGAQPCRNVGGRRRIGAGASGQARRRAANAATQHWPPVPPAQRRTLSCSLSLPMVSSAAALSWSCGRRRGRASRRGALTPPCTPRHRRCARSSHPCPSKPLRSPPTLHSPASPPGRPCR